MKVVSFKVNLKTAFSDAQLLKSGWTMVKKNELYIRTKGDYKYSYIIKSYGKIKVSEIYGEINKQEEIITYESLSEFSFEEAFKALWSKSFTPYSIEILMKQNLFIHLTENNWKPSVLGVIEYKTEEYNLSYYYPAPEGEELYKLVDDNPLDVLNFVGKLRTLTIL